MISKQSQKKLKEIRDSHRYCCIKIFSDFNYVWDISVIEFSMREPGKHEETYRTSCYENLNKAVDELYKYHKESK